MRVHLVTLQFYTWTQTGPVYSAALRQGPSIVLASLGLRQGPSIVLASIQPYTVINYQNSVDTDSAENLP